jgi:hypothetical protein
MKFREVKEYFEIFYSYNKLEKLEEIVKFLGTSDLPRLTQENSNH